MEIDEKFQEFLKHTDRCLTFEMENVTERSEVITFLKYKNKNSANWGNPIGILFSVSEPHHISYIDVLKALPTGIVITTIKVYSDNPSHLPIHITCNHGIDSKYRFSKRFKHHYFQKGLIQDEWVYGSTSIHEAISENGSLEMKLPPRSKLKVMVLFKYPQL